MTNIEAAVIGKSINFPVKVTEEPAIQQVPKMYPATKVDMNCSYRYIEYSFSRVDGMVEYEVYRSKTKNGKYKEIDSLKQNNTNTDGVIVVGKGIDYDSDTNLYSFSDYDVKQNCQYFYKVRARFIDEKSNQSWGEFSEPVGYWTAAKPVKAKYNKKTRKVKWKKVKYAKYYVYTGQSSQKLGYNIFGGKVCDMYTKDYHTKKTSATLPKNIKSGVTYGVCDSVYPITKHGKYYYTDTGIYKSYKKYKLNSTRERIGLIP